MKRYAFTLMELMIALSLTAIVLGVIFSSLYQNSVLNLKHEKGAAMVMQKAHIQERLDQIFANIPGDEKSSLYTDENGALHFSFDHGIDPERAFCNIIPGKLELVQGELFLILMGDKETRTERLCSDVKALNYEFLSHDSRNVETTKVWTK